MTTLPYLISKELELHLFITHTIVQVALTNATKQQRLTQDHSQKTSHGLWSGKRAPHMHTHCPFQN